MSAEEALVHAARLLRDGQLPQAEAACRGLLEQAPNNAAAMHLLGLARIAAGDVSDGERLLRSSIEIDPQPNYRANLGKLLRRTRRVREAESEYRAALATAPDHRGARLGLARLLSELGRHAEAEEQCRILIQAQDDDADAWSTLAGALAGRFRLPEAELAYRRALAAGARSPGVHHNLGAVLSQMHRPEEALAELDHAVSMRFQSPILHTNRGRALLQLCRLDEAESAFLEGLRLDPRNADAHLMLAQLRHMRGDREFARDLTAAAVNHHDFTLHMILAEMLRRTGDLEGAEKLLRELLARGNPPPRVHASLAATLHEAGRLKEAEMHALEAAAGAPRDAEVIETLVAIQLSCGRPNEALPFIRVQRTRQPDDQRWIAYEASAARLLGDPLYRQLYDYERFVRVYPLEPPAGWSSMAELNAALLQVLNARQPFVAHGLDQSLRNGSQTLRHLGTDPDPVIQAVLKAFANPLRDYCQWIGSDPQHPLTRRNTGNVMLGGCWSVQLHRAGFHVNHVHAQGWISSAYYVSVPEETEDALLRAGWLTFGEPRLPMPGAAPERVVQPRAGQLVLFPSYMWHGTTPIHGTTPRTAISFDALPAPRGP